MPATQEAVEVSSVGVTEKSILSPDQTTTTSIGETIELPGYLFTKKQER